MSQKVKQQRNTNHGFAQMTCLLELHGIAWTGQEDSFHGVARKHEQLLGRCTDLHVTARQLPDYTDEQQSLTTLKKSNMAAVATIFDFLFVVLFFFES